MLGVRYFLTGMVLVPCFLVLHMPPMMHAVDSYTMIMLLRLFQPEGML